MSIVLSCPHCRSRGRIAPHYLGKKIRCRRCGHDFLAISDADTSKTHSAPPLAQPVTPPEAEAPGERAAPDDDYLL